MHLVCAAPHRPGAFATAYDVMNHWGANHGAISYGHIGADLITLCSMLRIPVCMHNVPEERIFRPASWERPSAWIRRPRIIVLWSLRPAVPLKVFQERTGLELRVNGLRENCWLAAG